MANNFPVINNGYNDFEEYLSAEGTPYPYGAGSFATSRIWNGQSSLGGDALGNTKSNWNLDNAQFVKSITFTSDYPCVMQVSATFGSFSLGLTFNQFLVNGSVTVPINAFKKIDQFGNISIVNVPQSNPNSISASVNQEGFIVTKSSTTPVNTNLKTYSVVVTITNYSGASSSGPVIISDSMPVGCNFISAIGAGFTLAQTGNSYTMSTNDAIANNGTKTYVLTVQGKLALAVGYAVDTVSISNDTDFSSRPMVWAGTSITNGTGITNFRNNYTYLLKDWLKDNLNVQTRVVNKAISSSQTNVMNDFRLFNNWYDFKQNPKFLFIEHGVNDVGQSIPTATSVSNVTNMINYYREKYPTCYIVILAPFPVGIPETESGLVTYRAAMQSLVLSYSSSEQVYIKYISGTGSAWDPVTQSLTYTTDNVHVNAAGRLLILNAITSYITTNGLTFS
jgi:lysophospholipase L1-like esterase